MLEHLASYHLQLSQSYQLVQAANLNIEGIEEIYKIVVVGMGGSAIGADIVRGAFELQCQVPFFVVRDYYLPAFIGPHTLVIASSHSGETEETLACAKEAKERGAKIICITTGGALAAKAKEWRVPLLQYDSNAPPRAAVGFSIGIIAALLAQLDFIDITRNNITRVAVALQKQWHSALAPGVKEGQNKAKQLARQLRERQPIFIGAGALQPVARRLKTQFNENAKQLSAWEALPELDHNFVVGTRFPKTTVKNAVAVLLCSQFDQPRIKLRQEITKKLLEKAGMQVIEVKTEGKNMFEEALCLMQLGDAASVYAAFLNRVDPTEINPIEELKAQLRG